MKIKLNFKLVFLLMIICTNLNSKANYQEQELKPVFLKDQETKSIRAGRTYNQFPGMRNLAPKKKTYPVLEQLEELLYPSQDFSDEKPGLRLERLEIATFGDKQNGKIPRRLADLRNEIESWQIANEQAMTVLQSKKSYRNDIKKAHAFNYSAREQKARTSLEHQARFYPVPSNYSTSTQAKKRDYDYMNYRMASPLMQNVARKTIDLLFK